jgi:signal transduction histidine kinase
MIDWAGFSRSLAARLVSAAAVWSIAILALGGVLLAQQYRASVVRSLDADLDVVIVGLIAAAETNAKGALVLKENPNDPRFKAAQSGRYWAIAATDGAQTPTILLRSNSLWDEPLVWPEGGQNAIVASVGKPLHVDMQGPYEPRVRVAAMSVSVPEQERPVIIMALADPAPALQDAERFTRTLVISLAALAAGLLAMVLVQVGVGLAPLNVLKADIAAIRAGRKQTLDGEYPTEVAPLTEELNALIAHNQDVVERARTHVGNLAHALKTPISVLLNEARGADGTLAALVTRQAEAMSANVQHYLERAQAAARAETLGARTEIAPVVEDIARTLERLYGREKDLALDLQVERGLAFRGERQDLEEMVGNLMENACKYGGGQVRVRAGASDSNTLSFTVDDDGPGLTPAQADLALKRGERLDETGPGAGLGLSIVDDLARLYGGGLTLGQNDLEGLAATLRLPRVD